MQVEYCAQGQGSNAILAPKGVSSVPVRYKENLNAEGYQGGALVFSGRSGNTLGNLNACPTKLLGLARTPRWTPGLLPKWGCDCDHALGTETSKGV